MQVAVHSPGEEIALFWNRSLVKFAFYFTVEQALWRKVLGLLQLLEERKMSSAVQDGITTRVD